MPLIDAHAHLDFPQFDADREAVIGRALEAGLVGIVNVGTNLASSRAAVGLASSYDFLYAAVGVHPHDADTVTPAGLDELRDLAQEARVVAIGEIGLDYYRDLSPREVQRDVFRDQLLLAEEIGLPVIVHSREAYEDALATLSGWAGGGVLHSYSGGMELLPRVLAMGFMIGISGPVTFRKAHALRAVAAEVPEDSLLIETDCPYLTPEPHRGRRNEPGYVRYVADAVATARGASPRTVAQTTTANARRLFGIA
jgi:TatD DNase family protein